MLDIYYVYAAHYDVNLTPEGLSLTWGWLMDNLHPLTGLCCVSSGRLVGLAHYREMPSPLDGEYIGFLDDLIVHREFRRNGIAKKLLKEIKVICQKSGWNAVWWITKDDNYEARKVYDKIARKTDWVLYEMDGR